MSVKIRLKRIGKIRAPQYRIVVADSRTHRDGLVIEEIGRYVPTTDPSIIEVNSERAQYWLGVGAQPTEPVAALLKLTGDLQASRGEKAENKVLPQKEKVVFSPDDAKKSVLQPKAAKPVDAPATEKSVVEKAPVSEAPTETQVEEASTVVAETAVVSETEAEVVVEAPSEAEAPAETVSEVVSTETEEAEKA